MIRENQKGITLIALAITIGVLIIISFVSIASLTSDNGIIKQTNVAKVEKIEGDAREQVGIGLTSMNLAILEARGRDNSYSAVVNSSKIKAELIKTLNADKTGLVGEFTNAGIDEGDNASEIKIAYTGDDYKTACNDTNAQIVYTLTLNQRAIELKEETNATLKDQNQENVTIDVGGKKEDGAYLVDKVEIGDYVDIGIDYTNKGSFSNGYTTNTSALTGWRVLSKNGTGAEGTVTLVSAGTPLRFYMKAQTNSSQVIETYFNNLNTEITIVASETQGFTGCGFTGVVVDENNKINLSNIWLSNSNIDGKTAHVMTTGEIETVYAELTGTTKTMINLYNMNSPILTSKMLSVNPNMSTKATDLIGIGMTYWLGGSVKDTTAVWAIYYYGLVDHGNYTEGIRPVFSLKSGVQIAGDNTGTGENESTAYKLAD